MTVFRNGKTQDVTIKLGEQPEDLAVSRNRNGRSGGDAEDAATSGKGKVGLALTDVNDELAERFGIDKGVKGALVRDVDPKSPAAREGIRPGDVITEVGGQKVTNAKEARDALTKADLSKGVRLYVVTRDGSRFAWVQGDEK
jgi:serine protease Do